MNSKQVDEWVYSINERVEKQIDCTQCGACCNQLIIHVTDERADIIAAQKKITRQEFDDL